VGLHVNSDYYENLGEINYNLEVGEMRGFVFVICMKIEKDKLVKLF
jgi:hypothetical protein